MLIGQRLQKLRKKRKITQKTLAEKAGISRSYLADVEHNRYNPSLDTIESLAHALKLDMKAFFGDALLEDSYYLKPLNKLIEEDEIEELSDNQIENLSKSSIIKKEMSYTPNISDLSDKELKNIGKDLEAALDNLNNLDQDLFIDDTILDLETRTLLRNSLEHSMQVAKALAKSKFNPKKK